MSFDADAVRHAYETIADGYAGRFGHDLEHTTFDWSVLDNALDLIPPSAVVLGVDLTPAMLDVARRHHPDIPLINADVLRLPVHDGAIDAAVAWFSLHNLPRSLLSHALAEVKRVLRKDGVFVMVTHVGAGEEWVEHDWHGRTEQVPITYHDSDELRSTLDTHQLRTIDVRSRPPLEHEHAVTKIFVTASAQ